MTLNTARPQSGVPFAGRANGDGVGTISRYSTVYSLGTGGDGRASRSIRFPLR